MKDKLRRAAQFSGAGLVVPEELSLFKKDGYQKDSGSSEASEEVFPRKFVDSTYAKECNRNLTGRKSKNDIENNAMKAVECERIIHVGMGNPESEIEGTFDLFDMLDSTIKPSVASSSCEEIDLQVELRNVELDRLRAVVLLGPERDRQPNGPIRVHWVRAHS